jgi:hypothetical protein
MTNKNTDTITTTASDTVPRATPGDRRDPIEVAGTPGKIAKFATAVLLTDSIITEDTGRIGVGTAPLTAILTVTSAAAASPAISARNTAPGGSGVSSDSPSGNAVLGVSQSGNGVFGKSPSGIGVSGDSTGGIGVLGTSDSGNGVSGRSSGSNGVVGLSTSGAGVLGSSATGPGVFGSSNAAGVSGESSNGTGVSGKSSNGTGVSGESSNGLGVFGRSTLDDGIRGVSSRDDPPSAGVSGSHAGAGFGIYGENIASGLAGFFFGNVDVSGRLRKGSGGFLIDHPLDPANKTLTHSFVESPDMMNIYNGTTTTDAQGNATITLPAYFQALNREFRYQLTVIEQFAQAIVSSEIQENHFTIKTDKPHVKVSWMVTGVRQDAYANAHRLSVEDDKPAKEQGTYLHPEAHGQPKSKGVNQPRLIGERQPTPGAGEMQPMNADAARQRFSTQS